MVRSFATSAARLRNHHWFSEKSSPRMAHDETAHAYDPLLDRAVPALVVVVLLITIVSMLIQFTTTRHEALASSEDSLAVAAWLATRIVHNTPQIEEPVQHDDAMRRIRSKAWQPGRDFIVLDAQNIVRGGTSSQIGVGTPGEQLFAIAADLHTLLGNTAMHRVHLANLHLVSITARPLAATGGTLITYQSMDDELVAWRRHSFVVGAILLCFGAITIAFCAAYYAQRARTRHAGLSATQMRDRFEVALERGHCALWDYAVTSDQIEWSSSMYRLLGMEQKGKSMTASAILALLHPDDISPLTLAATLIADGKREIDHLFRMHHRNGKWIWLRMRAMLIEGETTLQNRLLGIIMDVTGERLAEEEGHRADLRLRDAIESISEAFVLWDENNRLVLCNSKYQSFHGLPTNVVQRGTLYRNLMASAHEPHVMIEIDRGAEKDGSARAYEAQFQDGRWLLISERHTADGGYVSVGTDITARKLQEERLLDNERQLRMTITDLAASREVLKKQAGQLTELADRYLEQKAEVISANRVKAEFLANMNHEIRTPLNHIIGFAEMMEAEVFGPIGSDRYREYVTDIKESGASLLGLISDILDMARIEAGRVGLNRSMNQIGALLGSTGAQVHAAAQSKGIALDIEPDVAAMAGQRLIHVDANAIEQALVHLMRNAIRLSPLGGKVSMRARMQGDHINIFIADAGCMLTATEIGAMKDPFGHIDGMLQDGCKGSGLGVAIARSLIELHGGTLRMRSSQQIGSLVMIHLPIAQEAVQLSLPMTALGLGQENRP